MKKYDWLKAILAITLIALVIMLILPRCSSNDEANINDVPDIVTTDNNGYTATPDGYATVQGISGMCLEANTKTQTVDFYNDMSNDCDIIITLYLSNGTLLYTSPIIKPGGRITDITIDSVLDAGTYSNAILVYDFYSGETNQILSRCEMSIELSVS